MNAALKTTVGRWTPQPLIAILVSGLALYALVTSWISTPWAQMSGQVLPMAVMTLGLSLAVVLADWRPIHIEYHTKVALTTVPLYLIVVLLPPPLAALATGATHLVAELLHRKTRGNYPSDIATCVGRWVLLGLVGSWVAHFPADHPAMVALIFGATAVILFSGDLLTSALELTPIVGGPPHRVMVTIAREAGPIEGVQYLLGMLGAFAALYSPWTLVLLIVPLEFVNRAFKRATEVHSTTQHLLEHLADTVDLRDPYTGGHSRRVTALCGDILRELGLNGPDNDLILTAARVHDIGKIGVPDGILNKPGPLTPDERSIMETHAARGAELLTRYPDFVRGVAIVRHHHERWDGKGYPDGIAGFAIPFGARVIAVADSFDAMTSDRPYRRGMSISRAMQVLVEGKGTQWDPDVVDAFLCSLSRPGTAVATVSAPAQPVEAATVASSF
jgi:putative nucleotidyltransferase with HDIG domain